MGGMIRTLLDQARERDESISVLWASQAELYSRFGFGPATVAESWQIGHEHTGFAHSPVVPGNVRFVDHDEAMTVMPAVWEAAAGRRTGFLDRSKARWRYFTFDEERVRGGWSGLFHFVYKNNGKPEGYAAYRLKNLDSFTHDLQMRVVDSVTTTDAAHSAIWQRLFNIDLVRTISAHNRPQDDPVWWMLADPRQLKKQSSDGLWVRLLDIPKALSQRGYGAEGRLVITVEDSFMPETGGAFSLEATASEATCSATTEAPDLSLSASGLGAVYLGGTRVSTLARAGCAVEHSAGALRLFDRMFVTPQQPWCPHEF